MATETLVRSIICIEHDALLRAPYQPYEWIRFINDILMIWTEGPEKLEMFVDYLNNSHSTIKFTCSHSLSNVPFLDVMVSVKDSFIETDLYTKLLTNTSLFSLRLATLITPNTPFLTASNFAFAAFVLTMTVTYYVLMNL